MKPNIEEIEFSKEPLRDDDVYCVGCKKEGMEWEILGVFDNKENAFINATENDFIVRMTKNKMIDRELVHPKQMWWKIGGEILKSSRFVEDNQDDS